MFQGSGGSALSDGGTNVIDPSAPPNESPDASGGVNPGGRDVLNESRPNELKSFPPKGVRRSGSAGQKEPSLPPNVRDGAGGTRNGRAVDGVFTSNDVNSSSSSICPRMSFNESERESVDDRSVREELGPATGAAVAPALAAVALTVHAS